LKVHVLAEVSCIIWDAVLLALDNLLVFQNPPVYISAQPSKKIYPSITPTWTGKIL